MSLALPSLDEQAMLLRSLTRDQARQFAKLWRCVTHAGEFLSLCVADWLTATTPLTEMEIGLLVQSMSYTLEQQATRLEKAEEGAEIPPCQLGLAEYHYATWTDWDRWLDIRKAEPMPKLSRPAPFTVALDVNVLWFWSLHQLDQIRQGKGVPHGNRADTEAAAGGTAGE